MSSPAPTTTPATTTATRRDPSSLPFRPPDAYTFLSLRWRRAQAEVAFKEVERALKTKLRQDINLKGDDIKKVFEYDVRRDGDSGAWWFRFIVEIADAAFEHVVQEIGSGKSSNLTLCAEEDAYKPRPPPKAPTPPPKHKHREIRDVTPSPPHKKARLSRLSSSHEPSLPAPSLPALPSLPTMHPLPSLPVIDFPTSLPIPQSPPLRPIILPEDSPWFLAFDDHPPPDCPLFDQMRWDHARPMLRFVNDSPSTFYSPGMDSCDLPTSPATPASPITPLADGTNLPRDGRRSASKRGNTYLATSSRAPSLPEMPTAAASLRPPSTSPEKHPFRSARSPTPSLPSMPTPTPSSSASAYLLPPDNLHPAPPDPEDQFAAQMKKARAGISGSLPGVPRKRKVSELDPASAAAAGSGLLGVGGVGKGGRGGSRGGTPLPVALEGFASVGEFRGTVAE